MKGRNKGIKGKKVKSRKRKKVRSKQIWDKINKRKKVRKFNLIIELGVQVNNH